MVFATNNSEYLRMIKQYLVMHFAQVGVIWLKSIKPIHRDEGDTGDISKTKA